VTTVPSGREFTVIGENVHTTRVLRLDGPQVGEDEHGRQAIVFEDDGRATRFLPIPESEKESQPYLEGRIKHVRVAVELAMAEGDDACAALAYLRTIAQRQIDAGAHFLDVNVDEISPKLDVQKQAMRWLAGLLAPESPVPLSIDSSNLEIIETGFEAVDGGGPTPMLNSASLERIEALDLAAAAGGEVIVTASGESGMPSDADERVANASRIVELAFAKGIGPERIHVDALVFPISVDGAFGNHCLEAFRRLRAQFGPEINLTGGMSNISFGLPNRRLVNDAFLALAVDAGADSGIIDPVTSSPQRVLSLDRDSRAFRLAVDVLTGADEHCRAYLKAWRGGELADP
jgi:5-methyltetrahydrofolate--homocysteine methyltransferase